MMRRGTPIRVRRGVVGGIPLAVVSVLVTATSSLAAPPTALSETVRQIAGRESVVYVVDSADRVLVDVAADRDFIPASTIKLFTALLALERLGPDFRFRTRFSVDGDELVVRGGGDPFLVSEEIDAIAAALVPRLRGRSLRGIVIDDSYFEPGVRIPGVERTWRSYDAPNSATAVNFNTISVVRREGAILSGEEQTPLTPHALTLASALRFGTALRFQIGDDPADVQRYAGELLRAKLVDAGGEIGSRVRAGVAGDGAELLYVHANSRTLAEVCRAMLSSSNNFVANQVFLTVGAETTGGPASLARSIRAAAAFIDERPGLQGLDIVEGSGIAYENRATGPAMASLLGHFAPYRDLLRERHGSRHKTGTLKAVASLAGYLDSARHGTVRYALALPGGEQERRWQIVRALRDSLD